MEKYIIFLIRLEWVGERSKNGLVLLSSIRTEYVHFVQHINIVIRLDVEY